MIEDLIGCHNLTGGDIFQGPPTSVVSVFGFRYPEVFVLTDPEGAAGFLFTPRVNRAGVGVSVNGCTHFLPHCFVCGVSVNVKSGDMIVLKVFVSVFHCD